MKKGSLVRRLIDGSHAIDLMRKEVKEVIGILISKLRSDSFWQTTQRINFRSKNCEWVVELQGYMLGKHDLVFKCTPNRPFGTSLEFSSKEGEIVFGVDSVQDVYESLPILLDNLMKFFPQLKGELAPIFRASSAL